MITDHRVQAQATRGQRDRELLPRARGLGLLPEAAESPAVAWGRPAILTGAEERDGGRTPRAGRRLVAEPALLWTGSGEGRV